MGNKLSHSQAMASERAAQAFENRYEWNSLRTISYDAGEGDTQIVNDVPVQVYPKQYGKSDLRSVNISWEDAGLKDYRKLGLYGSYSCTYNKMSFKDDTLVIESDDGLKIYIN